LQFQNRRARIKKKVKSGQSAPSPLTLEETCAKLREAMEKADSKASDEPTVVVSKEKLIVIEEDDDDDTPDEARAIEAPETPRLVRTQILSSKFASNPPTESLLCARLLDAISR